MKSDTNLAVLVTGAAGDIGQALCRRLLTQGHRIAMLDRNEPALARAADALRPGGSLVAVVADVTRSDTIAAALTKAEAELGPVSALVNNAGGVRAASLAATEEADWLADIDRNLNGAWRCIRAVRAGMIARGGGSIVNIGSVNAFGIYGHPAYSAAKAGLMQLTRFTAVELARHGIRSNAVCPGTVRTQAWSERLSRDPGIFERLKRWYPLGEVCTPEDVAGVVAFLLGADARMINGAVIPVDGGLLAGSATIAGDFIGSDL
jgi:NAD(P)-dependent dehydrogenase (short-subunit alcohol dehydrogenase family)